MKMTVLEAAYRVLCAAGKPLHQNEIAERIRRRWPDLLRGKTPGATVGSKISTDIKKPGVKSRFVQTAPATFGLREPSSVVEAADIVLCAAEKLLHYEKIAERIIHRWPRLLRGKTPGATVGSAISTDINKKGAKSRFVKMAPGVFGLRGYLPVIEAAYIALKEVGKPLHQDEIAKRILRHRLRYQQGKTPGDTVGARIYSDIKKNGAASRFVQTAPATFGLRGTSSTAGPSRPPRGGGGKPPGNPPSVGRPRRLTVLEAAYIVLKEEGKPLHQDEIAKRILRRKLAPLRGGTPGRTVGSAIYMDIKRNGAKSRFVQTAPATFGLRGPGDVQMTVLEAAYEVLREAGKSLHQDEIAKRIRRRWPELLRGKTPGATVGSVISTDIKNNGDASRFVRTAPATFGLRGPSTPAPPAPASATPPSGKPAPTGASLSFADAASEILKSSGKPMHYQDITQQALKEKLIITEGKTPAATMAVLLAKDIQRREGRSEQSRFVERGQGVFGLSSWEPHDLDRKIEDHNEKVREALLQRLRRMSPERLEKLIAELLRKMGFKNVETTPRSGDRGIDVRGVLVAGNEVLTRIAVQVKRWANNVQAPEVQKVRGSIGTHEQGWIITTSAFSSGAQEEAERSNAAPVRLMSGEQLVLQLVEHELGVGRRSKDLLELDSNLFEEDGEESTD